MSKAIELGPEFAAKVLRWNRGEITWAEVEGFTASQARATMDAATDLANRGQLKKAAALFEGLVAINPKDHVARAALGTVYQKQGRADDALAAYDEAVSGDPTNVVALSNRGELKLRRGDASGLDDIRRAIEADPQARTASGRRAKALGTAIVLQAAKSSGAAH